MKTITLLLLLFVPVLKAANASPKLVVVEYVARELTIENRIDLQFQCYGVPQPMRELIVRQAKLESGRFTNGLSKGNNVFSMRHPYKRTTTSLGPNLCAERRCGYAEFSSIESAVDDYILYMKHFNVPDTFKTNRSYAVFLKSKRYYECSVRDYIRALNSFTVK